MGQRILIVDADPRFLAQLSELLEYQGHDVVGSATAGAALEAVGGAPFQLIITEMMPSGLSLTRLLESVRDFPDSEDTPVLVVAHGPGTERLVESQAGRLGVIGFIPRSSNTLDFGPRIDEVLLNLPSVRAEVRRVRGLLPIIDAAPARGRAPDERPTLFDGAGDGFLPMDTGRRLPSTGVVTPDGLVRFLATVFQSHTSGEFQLHLGGVVRTIYSLNGYPVWVDGPDCEDALLRVLIEDGLLSREAADSGRAIATKAGIPLHRVLTEERLVQRTDLAAGVESLIIDTIAVAVRSGGNYQFLSGDGFAGGIPIHEVNPIRALWRGVCAHLPPEAAAAWLDPIVNRPLGRTRTFNRLFGYIADTAAIRLLGEHLGQARSSAALRELMPASRVAVDRALWLMLNAGLVDLADAHVGQDGARPSPIPAPRPTSNPRTDSSDLPEGSRSTPLPPPGRTSNPSAPGLREVGPAAGAPEVTRRVGEHMVRFDAPLGGRRTTERMPAVAAPQSAEEAEAIILRDHVARLELDHYEFLGVARGAVRSDVDSAYALLAPRYRLRGLGEEMHPDTRIKARELLGRLILAVEELSDPKRRADYDVRLAIGRARITRSRLLAVAPPSQVGVEAVPPPTPSREAEASGELPGQIPADVRDRWQRARDAMDQSDWKRAYALLDALRAVAPSEGGILSDLGWSRWMAGPQDERTADKSLEWLQLALTFDPEHRLAAEAEARILHAVGREDELRRSLRRLLRLRPDHPWATAETARLAQAAPQEGAKSSSALDRLLGRKR